MGDFIGHECGLALVRLRQPLSYYRDRYADAAWGLRRLYLLMEKQHNRGQDGAGVATVKFDMPPGEQFMLRVRSSKHNALERVFDAVTRDLRVSSTPTSKMTDEAIKHRCDFVGEVHVGHLRYGTHSGHQLTQCHPLIRKNNTASRNLAIAGNFNMTNSKELFAQLVEYGLNPVGDSDTQVVLERLGYFLDREHEHLGVSMGPESFRGLEGRPLAEEVSRELDLTRMMRKSAHGWDGGYTFVGVLGNGDAFACRDPAGIRPGFFYIDDEVVAVASERAALANVFDVDPASIEAIKPGHTLVIKRDGRIDHTAFAEPLELRQCTFERIYFSRGNDPDIYRERKALGRLLAPRVLEAIDHDVEHAVFSFVPNTAESAYVGLIEEITHLTRARRAERLWEKIRAGNAHRGDLKEILNGHIRAEKIAHKDQRLRTFIAHDSARRDLVLHIYDITRGVVEPDDTLVVIDDSIVRGTTLRESIITILSRLAPRRILILSSAPPIMYPDCYGIDMSQLGRFIAFEAAVALLHERNQESVLDDVEARCRAMLRREDDRLENPVAAIYESFTLDEISAKVAQLARPATIEWDGEVEVMYQSVEGLRAAMPGHTGDWYFTGRYPTPGGYRVLSRSYLNWRKRMDVRAY
ncbi:MAG: amidophosphoribosyltransferase [Phycisphaerales bacterium]|nr:amidophosphoribosyltransferase [Phycisphaerae bacterium]NNF42827.1 amidophosphoribosyltransferase [Phycisphaerales bacterium]NNM27537.1 amidophosphoribosyltransferase [Phycisphaerales bacterium]